MKTRTTLVMRVLLALSLGIAFLAMPQYTNADVSEAQKTTVTIGRSSGGRRVTPIGSGFYISRDEIATNAHVVALPLSLHGDVRYYALACGGEVWHPLATQGKVDTDHDLAILKVSTPSNHVIRLADSDFLKVGDSVYVIGTPRGDLSLQCTVTMGTISREGSPYQRGCFQTDAAIIHGNSGGPVVDADGTAVGVSVSGLFQPVKFLFWTLAVIPSDYNFAVRSNHLVSLDRSESLRQVPITPQDLFPNAASLVGLGQILNQLGEHEAALSAYTLAISCGGTAAAAGYLLRGATKRKLGKNGWPDAVKAVSVAIFDDLKPVIKALRKAIF